MDNLESYSVSIAPTQSSIESEGLAVDADAMGKYSSLQPLCTRLCDPESMVYWAWKPSLQNRGEQSSAASD